MKVQSREFVEISDVFEGLDCASTAFYDADLPYTFGDANRTLIDKERVEDSIEEILTDIYYGDAKSEYKTKYELKIALERLGQIDRNVYVDLEN